MYLVFLKLNKNDIEKNFIKLIFLIHFFLQRLGVFFVNVIECNVFVQTKRLKLACIQYLVIL